jgi:hypothetical protein
VVRGSEVSRTYTGRTCVVRWDVKIKRVEGLEGDTACAARCDIDIARERGRNNFQVWKRNY